MDSRVRAASAKCAGFVVGDTAPFLDPALVDRLDLLETQFEAIEAPEQVWREVTRGEEPSGLEALREQEFPTVVPFDRTDRYDGIEGVRERTEVEMTAQGRSVAGQTMGDQ